eukprot:365718-Chlamydomonas_euryale.AAC.8
MAERAAPHMLTRKAQRAGHGGESNVTHARPASAALGAWPREQHHTRSPGKRSARGKTETER